MWKFIYCLLLVRLVESNNCFTTKTKAYRGFCVEKKDKIFVGDFDGNGSDDLLCHNSFSGKFHIIYSNKDPFHVVEWSKDLGWCKASGEEIYIGDFNGDGRSDLLCHNTRNGYKTYAFANNDGHFTGTTYSKSMGWCTHRGAKLYVGDFNGDGKDDIVCHDTQNRIWIGFGNRASQIHKTNLHMRIGACQGTFHVGIHWEAYFQASFTLESSLDGDQTGSVKLGLPHTWVVCLGYFNRDKIADVMCVNIKNGVKKILLFNRRTFRTTYDNSRKNNRWCTGSAFARVADVNGDGISDLVCKNYQSSGPLWVMRNRAPFYFDTTNFFTNFCHVAPNSRFLVGDFDGNGKKDFACHDGAGHIQVTLSSCR